MTEYTPTTNEMRWVYVRADRAALSREEYEAEFDRWLAKRDAEVAAKALEDAASAWQMNGWSNDMPEKGAERAQIILHMAQAATEMLHARAAEYRKAVQK